MPSQPHTPTTTDEEETTGQETQPQTYDDKLAAKIYEGYSSQNQIAIQAILALATMGVSYGKEVRDAYYILKNPLDPRKLVEDLEYKKRIERAIQLVKRHESKKLETGKSKLTKEVADSRLAISRVNLAYDQQHTIKSSLRFQYGVDLRTTYGFDEEQIKKIYNGALQRVKDRPNLSMQEAVRIEARVAGLGKVKEEVESDTSIKRRGDRKKEIERRLEAKDKEFTEKTARIYELEKEQCKKMQESAVASTSNILGIKPQLQTTRQPVPSAVKPPPVFKPRAPLSLGQKIRHGVAAVTIAATLQGGVQPKQPESLPTQPTPITWQDQTMQTGPTLRMPSIPPSIGSHVPIPSSISKLQLGFSKIFSPISNLFGGKMGGFLGRLGGFNVGGLAKKALGFAAKKIGLGAATGGAFTVIDTANDVIKGLTGIDLEKFALKAALFAVIAVVGVFLVVLVIGTSLLSGNTPDNPITLQASVNNQNNISWQELEKEYLSINDQPAVQADHNIWEQFTNDYLIPQQTQLSLEQNTPTN